MVQCLHLSPLVLSQQSEEGGCMQFMCVFMSSSFGQCGAMALQMVVLMGGMALALLS